MNQILLTNSQTKSIKEYCKLNNITNIDDFIMKCFTSGFNIEKYGLLDGESEVRVIEKEVIKEIPVEVIKEVEIIKEVPGPTIEVEVIKYIEKEVPVEKIVYISNEIVPEPVVVEKIVEVIKEVPTNIQNPKTLLLQETLQKLKKELSLKDLEIEGLKEKIKQLETLTTNVRAAYLKGSNLTEKL